MANTLDRSSPSGSRGSGSEDSYRVEITQSAHLTLPFKAEVTRPDGSYGASLHGPTRDHALAQATAWIKRDRNVSHEPEVLYL